MSAGPYIENILVHQTSDSVQKIPFMIINIKRIALLTLILCPRQSLAQDMTAAIESKATALQPKLMEWRRHIHQNPELGNREIKTAAYIVEQLPKPVWLPF